MATNANITIGAKTDKRSFQQTEQETKGFLNRLRRGPGGSGGIDASVDRIDKNVQTMNRMVGIFAAMEVAAEGVELGVMGIGAAIDSMSGKLADADAKWVAFSEKAKSAPLIGPGFRIGNMIGELIFRDKADAKRIEEETAEMAEAVGRRQTVITKAVSDYNTALAKSAALTAKAAESHTAALLEGIERDVFLMRQQTVKQSDAINEQLEQFRELSGRMPEQQERINDQIAALLDAQNQTWEQFNLERLRIEEDYQKKQADQQRKLADQLADIETQNRSMMLRLEGNELEAQLVQLRHHYDKRIEMAEDAAIREALTRQKAIAIEQAREGAAQAATSATRTPRANPSAPSIVEGLRLTGASRRSGPDYQKLAVERIQASDERRHRDAEAQLQKTEDTRVLLAEIARSGGDVGGLLGN